MFFPAIAVGIEIRREFLAQIGEFDHLGFAGGAVLYFDAFIL